MKWAQHKSVPTIVGLAQHSATCDDCARILYSLPDRPKPTGSGRKKGDRTERMNDRLTPDEKRSLVAILESLRKAP